MAMPEQPLFCRICSHPAQLFRPFDRKNWRRFDNSTFRALPSPRPAQAFMAPGIASHAVGTNWSSPAFTNLVTMTLKNNSSIYACPGAFLRLLSPWHKLKNAEDIIGIMIGQ